MESFQPAVEGISKHRHEFKYAELYAAAKLLYERYIAKEQVDAPMCFEYTKELIHALGGSIEKNLLELPEVSHWAAVFGTERGPFVVDITWSQMSNRFHAYGLHENLKGPLILPKSIYLSEIQKISK